MIKLFQMKIFHNTGKNLVNFALIPGHNSAFKLKKMGTICWLVGRDENSLSDLYPTFIMQKDTEIVVKAVIKINVFSIIFLFYWNKLIPIIFQYCYINSAYSFETNRQV